ncbi:DUF2497 domain-containing protein [Sphingomicrobium sp. XHP0239]|uniref:DUF2497 domain-containing protein n=1 Tax=Sphingomicrobium maritimum TaxID=3133972 RepID=UPI0031CC9E66
MTRPNEPSMEDILASIKKVIAEDRPTVGPSAVDDDEPGPDPANDAADEETAEDVLDLDAASMATRPGTGHQPATPPASVASLMAEETASGTRARLDELANAVASAPAGVANPLEEMVREMLRPMLKQWLDERLPGIVDEHVRSEISRITGRKL